MKKPIIDIRAIKSINRSEAKRIIKKVNQFYSNESSIEIIGNFKLSYIQQRQFQYLPSFYHQLKRYILDALKDQINNRVHVENQFII